MNHNAPRSLQTTELLHVTQHHFLHYITCLLHTSAPLLAHSRQSHFERSEKKKQKKRTNKQQLRAIKRKAQ